MRLRSLAPLALALMAGSAAAFAQPLDKRSFEDQQKAFETADAAARVAVAELWGKKREAKAGAVLARAVGSDADAEVRKKAAWALGTLGQGAGNDALRRALASDRDGGVRYWAAWALGRAGAAGVSALVAALGDKDIGVRAQAARSLGDVGERSAAGDLKKALGDSAAQVRKAAIVALQRLGVTDAEIRAALPSSDRGSAITAERKSQGLGLALGLVGAGHFYAEKPIVGAVTVGGFVVGLGLAIYGATSGAFDSKSICPDTGLPIEQSPNCSGLPDKQAVYPGKRAMFIAGAILAGASWLTSLIGTPIALTNYNKRIDEAKTAGTGWAPYFELTADSKIFGASFRF